MINIKDANGRWCVIEEEKIMIILREQKILLFGMTFDSILTLLQMYEMRGGILPPTPERIKEIFEVIK